MSEARYDFSAVEAKWRERWRDTPDLPPGAPAPRPTTPPAEASDSTEPIPNKSGDAPAPKKESGRGRRGRGKRGRRDDARRQRFYCLDMFPYPSLAGFSVNQLRGIAISDVVARQQEMRGRQVFRPFGWDSFGLSIEEEAEREGVSPEEIVQRGVEGMRAQLETFGARIDWQSEIVSSDPSFYRWTQWLFLKLREKGLATHEPVSMKWCPGCQMNLANEELADGKCVHCRGTVEERKTPQWSLRIPEYAERLHQGLRQLKWPQRVKSMQRHWIGRREGFRLSLKATSEFRYEHLEFDVFTRKLELLPAATYVVLAPEHPMVELLCDDLYREDLQNYRDEVARLTDRERLAARGLTEGCPTGAWALNPVTLKNMPIWVSKMVLPGVRFGTLLGVPGHNPLHETFARTHRLAVRTVLARRKDAPAARRKGRKRETPEEVMINCGNLSGFNVAEARRRIRSSLESRGISEPHIDYNLRDWVFARQRFWGEPIPMVHSETEGWVPVPEEDLPVRLPDVDRIPAASSPAKAPAEVTPAPARSVEPVASPSDLDETWDIFAEEASPTVESPAEITQHTIAGPLASVPEFVDVPCPVSGGAARRETDTMPQWAASCWYYLRYLDPEADDRVFDPERARNWLPVDLCVGGIEHAILHLLYVRFFSYFCHDLGLTNREEPFRRLFNQGRIYRKAPTEERKAIPTHSGDRINAGEFLERYGGDALRLHLLFLGPPAEDVLWNESGLKGARRFLERAYEFTVDRKTRGRFVSRKVLVEKHRLIRRVTTAIRTFKMNKAVSAFMTFVKVLTRPPLTPEEVDLATLKTFATLLAPFTPHLAAELWELLEGEGSVFTQPWPEYSEELLKPVEVEIGIQIDDRLRDRLVLEEEVPKHDLIQLARSRPRIEELIGDRQPTRVVVVPGRLINFVMGDESEDASPEPDTASDPS